MGRMADRIGSSGKSEICKVAVRAWVSGVVVSSIFAVLRIRRHEWKKRSAGDIGKHLASPQATATGGKLAYGWSSAPSFYKQCLC